LQPGGIGYHIKGINGCRYPSSEISNFLELFAPVLPTKLNDLRLWTGNICKIACANGIPLQWVYTDTNLPIDYKNIQDKFKLEQERQFPQLNNSKNYLIDNFYLGNSLYYDNTRKDVVKPDPIALQKADVAFGNVITASPTTQDAYIFRARTNRLLENDEMMATYYQQYLDAVTAKGEEEVTKNKAKFIESYNNIASTFANTDKAKAKELLNKTLALDPANAYALEAMKLLK
jgi:hypothetical protein